MFTIPGEIKLTKPFGGPIFVAGIVSIYQSDKSDVLDTTKVQEEEGLLSLNTSLSDPVIYHKAIKVLLAFSQII